MATLTDVLSDHYYDAAWSREHQGFRCVCGWLGEDHVAHVVEIVSSWLGDVLDRELCTCDQCEDGDNYNDGVRAVQKAVVGFLSGGPS